MSDTFHKWVCVLFGLAVIEYFVGRSRVSIGVLCNDGVLVRYRRKSDSADICVSNFAYFTSICNLGLCRNECFESCNQQYTALCDWQHVLTLLFHPVHMCVTCCSYILSCFDFCIKHSWMALRYVTYCFPFLTLRKCPCHNDVQGEHKVLHWLQTFITRKLRGIQ
jgi:hypothetical protein